MWNASGGRYNSILNASAAVVPRIAEREPPHVEPVKLRNAWRDTPAFATAFSRW
jgi:hypothetical protein